MVPQDKGGNYSYQKGSRAERCVLEDLTAGAKRKKLLLFVDGLLSVGDRSEAFLDFLVDRGAETAKPLIFFIGFEYRDHFLAIARTRITEKAKADFNAEKLLVPGYVPLPPIPAAWAGKVPDLAEAVKEYHTRDIYVATVDDEGRFLVPKDSEVPVQATPEI